MPQALLILSFLMNLIILVLSSQITNLSPQYATFGSQKFKNDGGDFESCSLNAISSGVSSECKPSNVSSILNKQK